MKNNNETQRQRMGLIPKLAKKIGEHSVNQTCTWWANQPKVPNKLKKD